MALRIIWIVIAILVSLPAHAWYRHGKVGGGGGGVVPVLSAATSLAMGWSDVRGGVTTDTGSGTLYSVVQLAATAAPSATQIKACQTGTGGTPAACTNQAISSSGTKSPIKLGCTQSTCLSSVTSYKVYFVHNASGGDSNVVNSAFTTNGKLIISSTDDTTSPIKWNDNPDVANWNLVRTAVLNYLQNTYSSSIDLHFTIEFGWQYVNGVSVSCFAASTYFLSTLSYSTASTGVRAKLQAYPNKNSAQTSAYATLAASDQTGLGDTYELPFPAFYNLFGSSPGTIQAGWSGYCNTTWNTDPTGTSSNGSIQLYGVMLHEITEVMGRESGWNSVTAASTLDALDYTSAGVIGTAPGQFRYMSANGGTNALMTAYAFNHPSNCNVGGGDCGDLDGGTLSVFNASGSAASVGIPPLTGDVLFMTLLGFGLTESGATAAGI